MTGKQRAIDLVTKVAIINAVKTGTETQYEIARCYELVSRSQTLTFFYKGRKSRVWSTYVELFVLLTQPAG